MTEPVQKKFEVVVKDTRKQRFYIELYGGEVYEMTRRQWESYLEERLLEEYASDKGKRILRIDHSPYDWKDDQLRKTLKALRRQDRQAKEGEKIVNYTEAPLEKE